MIISDAGACSAVVAQCLLQSHAGLDLWGWPAHRTSRQMGFGKQRGAGSQLCVLAHPSSWVAPRAGCKLVQLRAAIRCTPSFASGHVWSSRVGGKQPKRRKTCHSLHRSKACWALPQHAQEFSSGKPDSDFHPQDKHITSPALCFYRPDPWKNPSVTSVQGRGALQRGCRLALSLCLPVAAHVLHGCCLFPPESCSPTALSSLLPRWGFSCSHLHPGSHTRHSPGWLPSTGNRRSERLQGHVPPVQGITWSAVCFAYGTPGGPPGNFSLLTGNGKGCCMMGTALANANTQCILHSLV